MSLIIGWVFGLLLHPPHETEITERLAPPGWQGNFWGPEATRARHEGKMPPIVATAHMARWDRWGRQVLRDGDIVFRLGDARVGRGYFPMSRFLARASNSKFSHTGIVSIEVEGPVVYDISRTSVARQPFCVWALDNIGSIGVKRLRPEYKNAIPKVIAYCHRVFEEQIPFDYQLSDDDTALYCVEMTEKAFRSAGIELSKPIRLGDMERASEFPLQMFGLRFASKYALEHPLTFDQLVYFPGNENHGIWSARQLMTVVPATYAPGHPDFSASVSKERPTHESGTPSTKKVSSPGPVQEGAAARSQRSGT
jgi:Permuted papain-like amidase enzyme, YaeF/YiiX, C92 family